MCDSSSDESSLADYLPTKKKPFSKPAPPQRGPAISYTGSNQQPLCLDDDSDASSELEILPPTQKKAVPPKAKKPASSNLLDFSDSDSDDSILEALLTSSKNSKAKTTVKKPTDKQLARKAEQERKKAEKLEAKKAQQARKKAEREVAKQRKEAEKEAAKESRKRQRLEQQQARGIFATSEIVLLVDPPLFRRQDCYDWKEHDEICNYNCMVQEYASALGGPQCHALQWIRKDHLEGGAEEAWKQLGRNNHQGYTHVDRLIVVFDDPKVFIDLLRRSPQDDLDDDYPRLRQWLRQLEHGWKAAWPQNTSKGPKVFLLLHNVKDELDRQWVEHRRKYKNSQRQDAIEHQPPRDEDYYDAMTWVLIQFQVECKPVDSYEEIWTQALKMTRAIAKKPYDKPMTELECIKRMKPLCDDKDTDLNKAKDAWVRQLRMIPRISEAKARHLVAHYPTMNSLWQAFNDPETSNPEELVAGCLSDRYEQKVASDVYKVLTSTDPDHILN